MKSVNNELNQPPIENENTEIELKNDTCEEDIDLKTRIWIETRKLWHIVGPSIFHKVATNAMNMVTQVFAGHLGDLDLASISIANTVIVGFNFGLLLGMASALETLCGQAFGAKKHHMLGIYLQRSWIVLFSCCFLLLPFYIFATPLLKFLGQADDVAEQSGLLALWLIPLHFSFAFQFPLQRFLQSQLKTGILIWVALVALVIHVIVSWLCIYQFGLGIVGAAIALDVSWWFLVFGMFGYILCGNCPESWTGFSLQAFTGLWEFLKLSAASGVMLCLENWYYRILLLMTGYFENSKITVDALSICTSINIWGMTIALSFFAGTGVRVANELGAGNGKAAKFATKVSVVQSTILGVFFCILVMVFRGKVSLIFSSSTQVLKAVDKLSFLLAMSILLNSVQQVLSGVAVGSGWQAWVAYINIGCYYIIGLPIGMVLGVVFKMGVGGIWGGMIFGGTAVQTIILALVTIFCNWENEAEKITNHVEKLSISTSRSQA